MKARNSLEPNDDKRHRFFYSWEMEIFTWCAQKNDMFKKARNISFEEVLLNIQLGNEIDIFNHPNQERRRLQYQQTFLLCGKCALRTLIH